MNITAGYWKTRDGRKARVLCVDAQGRYPCVGYVEYKDCVSPESWTEEGANVNAAQTRGDLVSPWIDAPVIDWSKEREWVKAIALDGAGIWFRYSKVPNQGVNCWHDGGWSQRLHPSEQPQFTGDWKDSLCVRPEGGAK